MLFFIIIFPFLVFIFLIGIIPSGKERGNLGWIHKTPFAHRGLYTHSHTPENSLPAFKMAMEKGFGIELDIHLTKDGKAVVFHDETLHRLTDGHGFIKDHTLQELQNLKLLGTQEFPPSLEQVLELIKGTVPLLIEIKNWDKVGPLEEEAARLLEDYKGPFAIISFNPEVIAWFAKNKPSFIRGQTSYLYEVNEYTINFSNFEKWLYRNYCFNWKSKPDFLIYDVEALPRYLLTALRSTKPLIVYGVENSKTLDIAREHADNIIFDHIEQKLV